MSIKFKLCLDVDNFSPQQLMCPLSSVQSLSCVRLFATPRLQHARLPCPSPTPGVYPNSCPLSRRCHPTISSSVVSFSSCLQSFLASGSLQMSQFFASGGQRIGDSVSASVLPMNIQDLFPLELTGLISLQSKGLSRVFSSTTIQKPSILWQSAFFMVQLSHPYRTTGKTVSLTRQTFVSKMISLLFNMLSRAPNSLQMVTAAMKLKLFFFLEEKLSPT